MSAYIEHLGTAIMGLIIFFCLLFGVYAWWDQE